MRVPRVSFATSIAIAIGAVACGRIGFDLLPAGESQKVVFDGGPRGAGGIGAEASPGAGGSGGDFSSGGTTGGVGGASRSTATGGKTSAIDASSGGGASTGGITSTDGAPTGGVTSTGGAPSTGGVVSTGGVTSTGGAPVEGGPPPLCADVSRAVQTWTFDATVQGWAFWPSAGAGTLTWTSSVGNPTPGALSLDVQSGTGLLGWIVLDGLAANVSGQTGTVWIWLDTPAATAGVKLYAQSNVATYAWADGGFVSVSARTWTCLHINFDTPVYKDATFDPTAIVRFGIELSGTGPFTLYVDQFAD